MEQDDGSYKGVYCHWDGYIEHNGGLLLDYYNTREMAEKLIELGDLSSLQPKLYPDPAKPHKFWDGLEPRQEQELVTLAYGRDRGEKGTEAKTFNLKGLDTDSWGEYFYVFTKDNQWKYFTFGHLSEGLRDLAADLAEKNKGSELEAAGVFSEYKLDEIRQARPQEPAAEPQQKTEMEM